MHGVYLAPWTCKVFRGRFLCAIYTFSFIHSHTATPEALCYTTPGQRTKQRTKLPLAQWPGTALRCWGLSRWWTWVSPQRSRPWTRPAGTPALQPPVWPSAQRLLSSCWAGPCPAGSGQREQEGVQEWSLITGADDVEIHTLMYGGNNNNNILYSSQWEIKAVVRSHNKEHISLSHETHS